jgi:hypothetical protein
VTDACLDCEINGFGFPCRVGGECNVEALAGHYLREFCSYNVSMGIRSAEQHWSFDCVRSLIEYAPETAWRFILAATRQLKTTQESDYFAAGPPEDLICKHGIAFIDRIEAEAYCSPRFAFVLTGVWAQGNDDTPVWKRIEMLKDLAPDLADGDQLPEI